MDSKQQFGQLDPKLKEVYERVMGTSISSSPKTSPVLPQQPVTPAPAQMQQHAAPIPQSESPKPQMQTSPAPQSLTQAVSVKPHGHISPVVWILGGVAFIIIYALAWIKIFNLKLPFTP